MRLGILATTWRPSHRPFDATDSRSAVLAGPDACVSRLHECQDRLPNVFRQARPRGNDHRQGREVIRCHRVTIRGATWGATHFGMTGSFRVLSLGTNIRWAFSGARHAGGHRFKSCIAHALSRLENSGFPRRMWPFYLCHRLALDRPVAATWGYDMSRNAGS